VYHAGCQIVLQHHEAQYSKGGRTPDQQSGDLQTVETAQPFREQSKHQRKRAVTAGNGEKLGNLPAQPEERKGDGIQGEGQRPECQLAIASARDKGNTPGKGNPHQHVDDVQ